MTKEIQMTNDESVGSHVFELRASSLIRHSSFCSGSAHSRNFRKTEHPIENFFARRILDLIDRDRICHIEPAGRCPAQRFQMRAAAEGFADVMRVRADIEPFAA